MCSCATCTAILHTSFHLFNYSITLILNLKFKLKFNLSFSAQNRASIYNLTSLTSAKKRTSGSTENDQLNGIRNRRWFLKIVLDEEVVMVYISFSECNSDTMQKLPFGVNNRIELQNVTTASDNTGTSVTWKLPVRRH